MQFKNVFLGRRSIRRYKNKPVPKELIGEIIDLARFAPSSGNLQSWRFLVVTGKEKREAIADSCLQQTWMLEVPVHIIVCNDFGEVKDHYGKLGKMYSIQNCSNAAFALMLIAQDKGLGSCWVGAFESEALHREFDIPDSMDPEVIITLGYSDEVKGPAQRDDPEYLTFFETWGNSFTKFPSHLDKFKGKINIIKNSLKKLKK